MLDNLTADEAAAIRAFNIEIDRATLALRLLKKNRLRVVERARARQRRETANKINATIKKPL